MEKLLQNIDASKERHLSELFKFLSFKSISSEPKHNQDTRETAIWLKSHLEDIGMDRVELYETKGHPIVYAEWLKATDKPTVLIYGHYDVQPVDPLDLWDSPPFEPVIKNGKIYGRGTADDKGQLFTHVKAIESILQNDGNLPVNVKLIFEGEEECGSNNLDEFVESHAELLKCDTVVVSDTEWFADGLPSLCYSLRGISYLEIKVTGPNRDLHSGTFGGAVDNPINVLCDMISKLKDENGKITIPGFYDNVLELTSDERNGFAKLPYNHEEYCKDLDVEELGGEKGFTTLEKTWARPSLDMNGIYGGYTGDGAKTVLPSYAVAKLSSRLVPNQTHEEISEKIAQHLRKIAPKTVKVDINILHGGNPVLVPRENKSITAAQVALKQAFGKEAVFMREGGSIPIVGLFQEVLKAPTVLMGLGLPNDNIHSPNESFSVDNYLGGIKASAIFLYELSK